MCPSCAGDVISLPGTSSSNGQSQVQAVSRACLLDGTWPIPFLFSLLDTHMMALPGKHILLLQIRSCTHRKNADQSFFYNSSHSFTSKLTLIHFVVRFSYPYQPTFFLIIHKLTHLNNDISKYPFMGIFGLSSSS
jgi:hypothetical protein